MNTEQTNNNTANLHGEVSHEHTIYAEPIANINGFNITNSLINSWIVVVFIIIFSVIVSRSIKKVPGKLQNISEIIIDKFLNVFDSVTGSREKSEKFFPFVFSFFIFILLNNWIGLLPGIGSIGGIVEEGGHKVFIPLFRGATADLNTTLALALIAVLGSHVASIFIIGFWKYINKFINIKCLLEIPTKIKKDPSVIFINPIKIFTGLVEIVGEIAKVASLSFRLFGNIFAGEVLLGFMASIFAFGLPLPFMFMEVLVGFIQALIFSILVLSYFVIMTDDAH